LGGGGDWGRDWDLGRDWNLGRDWDLGRDWESGMKKMYHIIGNYRKKLFLHFEDYYSNHFHNKTEEL